MSNTPPSSKTRKFRPFDRELGLHQLEGFTLTHMEAECRDLLEWLDKAVEQTLQKAPPPVPDYELVKKGLGRFENEEHKMERSIWKALKPQGRLYGTEFTSACRTIPFYQVRIQRPGIQRPDGGHPNDDWGRVDLVGVDEGDHLPVLIELKKGSAGDTLLRVVVEVAAYGLALRKCWKGAFRSEWCEALSTLEIKAEVPIEWGKCRLVCAAPKKFWKRRLGLLGAEGKIRAQAWRPFFDLVEAFGRHGLTFEFVAVDFKGYNSSGDFKDLDEDGLPIVTGAKPLPLRDFVELMTD